MHVCMGCIYVCMRVYVRDLYVYIYACVCVFVCLCSSHSHIPFSFFLPMPSCCFPTRTLLHTHTHTTHIHTHIYTHTYTHLSYLSSHTQHSDRDRPPSHISAFRNEVAYRMRCHLLHILRIITYFRELREVCVYIYTTVPNSVLLSLFSTFSASSHTSES